MRVCSLQIDAFGALADSGLEDLPGGLVVLYGPNEAGKSSLLAFLRGALFGFPQLGSREPKYLPPGERRRAGRVVLEAEGRRLCVERSAPPPGKRKLALRFGDGGEATEADLARWLGHADAELYKNVFAFSLSELQGFESLSASGIQERIFSAGITGAGRSARVARERFEKDAEALLSKSGRKGRILELVTSSRELRRELERQREAARGYAALAGTERVRHTALESLSQRADAERRASARAHKLLDLWREVWSPLVGAREHLAKLEETANFPEDAKQKLSDLRGRIEHFEERVADLRVEQGACDRELERLVPSLGLQEVADEVAELERERVGYRNRLAQRAELQRSIDDQSLRFELLARDELGADFDRGRVAGFDASSARASEARGLREHLASIMRDEAALQARAARLREDAKRIELRLERAATARDAIDVDPLEDLEVGGATLRALRREVADRRVHEGLYRERETRIEALRSPRSAGWMGVAALFALMALGATGFFLFAAGDALLPGLRAEVAGRWPALADALLAVLARWPASPVACVALGLSAVAACGTTVASWLVVLARYRRVLAAAEQAVAVLRDELLERDRAIAELGTSMGLDGRPDDAELDRLELDLRRDRDRLAERAGHVRSAIQYGEELDTLERERDALDPEVERLAAEREIAETDIAVWRAGSGVPESVPIDQIEPFFQAVRRARQYVEAGADAAAGLGRVDAEIAAWEGAVEAVLRRAGLAAPEENGEALARSLAELAERCAADDRCRSSRGPLLERRTEATEKLALNERRLAAKRAELHELLRAGGATTEVEFRARLAVVEQRAELEREVDRCELELERRLGVDSEADALRIELGTGEVTRWEELAARAGTRARELEEERDEAVRQHRDLVQQVEELAGSAAVAETEQALGQTAEELARAVAEWRRLRLARGLVRETLARFERERQPEVLRDASELFARITDGRYRRVEQSAENEAFVVVDERGERRELGDLSRGTAEQLYLCVRLGLIDEFARRTVSLPVAMDDVLVNFDDVRAAATARVLGEFAARDDRQLLFFTCSERTRDLLLETAPGATALDLRDLR